MRRRPEQLATKKTEDGLELALAALKALARSEDKSRRQRIAECKRVRTCRRHARSVSGESDDQPIRNGCARERRAPGAGPHRLQSDEKALVPRGEGSCTGRLARLHVAHQSSRVTFEALDQARSHPPRCRGGQGRHDELVKLGRTPDIQYGADRIGVPGVGLHIQSRLTQLVGERLGSALCIGPSAQRHDKRE
jgi:hypothetical protein